MAFSNGGGGRSNGRSRFRGGHTAMAEINIVPLVDVVLVLLIIFMLTAHVMEFGIEVDVPKVKNVKDTAEVLPVVSMSKNGTTFLNEKETNINELATAIHKRFAKATSVYLRADKETTWDVMA